MSKQVTRPNLFVVGNLRSGTTLLYELLRQHPEIYFPEEKEPNFFNKDLYEESLKFNGKNLYFHITTQEEYFSLYQQATGEKYLGDATTTYIYSKSAPEAIFRFNPDAKIIIMIREPVECMRSLHSRLLNYLIETEPDFEKALSLEELRKKNIQVPPKARYPSYLFYREKSRYLDNILRYMEFFPVNQIYVIIFDNLIRNKLEELRFLFEFLGVDPDFKPAFTIVNANMTSRFAIARNMIQSKRFKHLVRNLIPTQQLYYKIKKLSEKILFRKSNRQSLDPTLKARLKDELRSSVDELNSVLLKNGLIRCNLLDVWHYRN